MSYQSKQIWHDGTMRFDDILVPFLVRKYFKELFKKARDEAGYEGLLWLICLSHNHDALFGRGSVRGRLKLSPLNTNRHRDSFIPRAIKLYNSLYK